MEDDGSASDYQAIILACGDCGRLYPLTEDTPISLLPIANFPLLNIQVEALVRVGFKSVLVVVAEESLAQVSRHCDQQSFSPKVSIVSVPTGTQTADALRKLRPVLQPDQDLLLLPGDLACDGILRRLVQVHRLKSAAVTVLLKEKYIDEDKKGRKARSLADDEEDIDVIGLAEEDWLVLKVPALDIEESLSIQKALLWQHRQLRITTGLQDTGVCILSKDVMDVLEKERGIAEVEAELIPYLVRRQFVLPKKEDNTKSPPLCSTARGSRLCDSACKSLIANLNPITAYEERNGGLSTRFHNCCHAVVLRHNEGFCGFVRTLGQYGALNREAIATIKEGRLFWTFPNGSHRKDLTVMGIGCTMENNVTCKSTILGNGCSVGDSSKVNNCVLMENVTIEDHVTIQNSVICANARIEKDCNLNDCHVRSLTTIPAGTKAKGETFTRA